MIGYQTVTIQPVLKASCTPPRNTTSNPIDAASVTMPDLRAPMAAGIAINARINAISAGAPADLSGKPARMVHRALAWTSTPGMGTDEIDVTYMSLPTGS